MKNISVRLTDAQTRKLARLARKNKTTQSEVVREAIEAYVLRGDTIQPESAAKAAADLAGCVDGPPDLSSNPDHMKGYGR